MPEITIDIEVWCSCGEGLCHQSSEHAGNRTGIDVEPCEKCINAARQEGHDEGYTERKEEEHS